ncbi:MAG: sulfatase [Deltaproteobacteria bacterium]|nr:sulfatase [Deltaproteobacteria bacterium]
MRRWVTWLGEVMVERKDSLLFAVALAIGVGCLDVARVAEAGRGWTSLEVLSMAIVSVVATAVFLLPALVVGLARPERGVGLLLASVALLYSAVLWRFNLLAEHSASSPEVLGGWLVMGVAWAASGWFLGPHVEERWRPVAATLGVLGVLGVLVGVAQVSLSARPAGTAEGPSVVLITIDTLRRDHVGIYGSARVATPNLDRVGEEGVVFDQAIATSTLTGPSHLAILSGLIPVSSGVVANATPIGDVPEYLPRVLRERGWTTAGFVSGWPLHEQFGFDQGFDVFDADFSPVAGLHSLVAVRGFDAFLAGSAPNDRQGDALNAAVFRWLSDVGSDEAFFLWVHYFDPHAPYEAPEPYRKRFWPGALPTGGERVFPVRSGWPAWQRRIADPEYFVAQYAAEVSWTDDLVGELLEHLDAHSDRPLLVILTSDHGESLTEHDLWFAHGHDLYDPGLRVPLLLWGPGVSTGLRVPCQVATSDIAPTVLAMIGAEDQQERDGVSIAGMVATGECADEDVLATTTGVKRDDPPVDHALRRPGAKYILIQEGEDLAFDLLWDPGELEPNSLDAALQDEMRGVIEGRLEHARPFREASTDDEAKRMLEALGYLEPRD